MPEYSKENIAKKINKYESKLRSLYADRISVNSNIKELQKAIKYWNEFDINQLKLYSND